MKKVPLRVRVRLVVQPVNPLRPYKYPMYTAVLTRVGEGDQVSVAPPVPQQQHQQQQQQEFAGVQDVAVQHEQEMGRGARRQCAGAGPGAAAACVLRELPKAPRCAVFQGKKHGNNKLAECKWEVSDGVDAGAFLDRWVGAEERAQSRLPIVLTLVKFPDGWVPWTLAMESCLLPGQLGLFGARRLETGDIVSWMLDGRRVGVVDDEDGVEGLMTTVGGVVRKYMYLIQGKGEQYVLMDGEAARDGGAKRANDARGLRKGNNAEFFDDGALRVGTWSVVAELRAGMSAQEKKEAEVTWSYGKAFWRGV